MVTLFVKGASVDASGLATKLDMTSRKAEIAAQRALIETAKKAAQVAKDEMERVFDRPTRYTLNAIKAKPTSKFSVMVGVVDDWVRQGHYLTTEMQGGDRVLKAFEKALQANGIMPNGWVAVPASGAILDGYGNVSAGKVRQVLSWFDSAERGSGSFQNMNFAGREKRRKGTKRRRGFEYFAISTMAESTKMHLPMGIYEAAFTGFGKAIKPIFVFSSHATYQKRFMFKDLMNERIPVIWDSELRAALARDLEVPL